MKNQLIKSFDLEIFKELPGEAIQNWKAYTPLGITLCGFGQDFNVTPIFNAKPQQKMEVHELDEIVDSMLSMQQDGVKFVTWNGTSFDFQVLAIETGRYSDCANLARNHCDMMLIAVWGKGWMVGLDRALRAHKLPEKLKTVRLNDGSTFEAMDGGHVPRLWAAGEISACTEYFKQDLQCEFMLARTIEENKKLLFFNRAGDMKHIINVPALFTVEEIMNGAMGQFPDTSWQTNPIRPEQFTDWMP